MLKTLLLLLGLFVVLKTLMHFKTYIIIFLEGVTILEKRSAGIMLKNKLFGRSVSEAIS